MPQDRTQGRQPRRSPPGPLQPPGQLHQDLRWRPGRPPKALAHQGAGLHRPDRRLPARPLPGAGPTGRDRPTPRPGRATPLRDRLTDRGPHQPSSPAWPGPASATSPERPPSTLDLCEAIRPYLALYPDPQATDPLLCPANCHSTALWWHRPISPNGLYKLVARKGTEAGITTSASTTYAGPPPASSMPPRPTGAHIFDLLDIQQVLGHSDPA